MTVSRELPVELRRHLLRCAIATLRRTEVRDVRVSVTDSDVVIEAALPG